MDEVVVLEEFEFSKSYKRGRTNKRDDKHRLWEQQDGKCWWCGRYCVLEGDGGVAEEFTVDHVIPLSRFGTNHWRNLVGACFECNKQRDLRWREIKIRWLLPPEPNTECSTFTLRDKFSILAELEFLPITEAI